MRRVLAFVGLCFWAEFVASSPSIDSNDGIAEGALITNIVDWVRANGGWISEKVEARQIVGALSGIYTNDPLEEGEVVVEIPWDLILKPRTENDDYCQKVENLREAMTKDPSDQTPYERYLALRPRKIAPYFFSQKAKVILLKLMKDFILKGFYSDLNEDWYDYCEQPHDEEHVHAMMLLQTRGEGDKIDLLVPFGDLANHRNGDHTNVDPLVERGKRYRLVTTRKVNKDEQLQNSYNQCKWCDGLYSNAEHEEGYYVTPQLYELYGFPELMPQRWIIPEARLIFDVEEANGDAEDPTSPLRVNFVAPPSEDGVEFLRTRLQRLREFKEKYEDANIPQNEKESIFGFYTAVVTAYSLALEQSRAEELSDEVWELDDTWHQEAAWTDEGQYEL